MVKEELIETHPEVENCFYNTGSQTGLSSREEDIQLRKGGVVT